MSDYNDEIDRLDGEAAQVTASLGEAAQMLAGFDSELRRMKDTLAATGQDVAVLEKGLTRGLRSAFDGLVFDGMKLSDALKTVAGSMVNTAYNAALKPVTSHFGGLLAQGVGSMMQGAFANGGAFSSGQVMPFANGGVVGGPTTFPMRGGMGLMGEAGPEAIMPLTRGADGKLGVRAAGGGGSPTIVMNISTPDAASFQRSRGQIAAQMSRAMARGDRNS
ncbi:MAG: phage tail tape measure protein [Paracoccaceae bacterium]